MSTLEKKTKNSLLCVIIMRHIHSQSVWTHGYATEQTRALMFLSQYMNTNAPPPPQQPPLIHLLLGMMPPPQGVEMMWTWCDVVVTWGKRCRGGSAPSSQQSGGQRCGERLCLSVRVSEFGGATDWCWDSEAFAGVERPETHGLVIWFSLWPHISVNCFIVTGSEY